MKIDTNTYRDIAYQLARYSQMNPALKKEKPSIARERFKVVYMRFLIIF